MEKIKGWTKKGKFWESNVKKYYLGVSFDPKENMYAVVTRDNLYSAYGEYFDNKRFETRKKALEYAVKWMKKNPKG